MLIHTRWCWFGQYKVTTKTKNRAHFCCPYIIVLDFSLKCTSIGDSVTKRYFEEALQSVESHEKSALALGNIYLRKKDYDMAEKNVMRILRFDPSNEEASMLMAELMMELAASGGRSEGGMQECALFAFQFRACLCTL